MKLVKVCGMREATNIREVEQAGADWIGFIFYPESPRFVHEVPDYLPRKSKRVGVFVNAPKEKISETISLFGLDLVQLHGNESPEFCENIRRSGVKVIKSFRVGDEFKEEEVEPYHGKCDYFLFDTQTSLYGGSGEKFNWETLLNYRGNTFFFLSGGITPGDAEALKTFSYPKCIGVDINSKFEISPAVKDAKLVKQFIKVIKNPGNKIDNKTLLI
jgi:phosphoribosylanthranilate isomerase